LADSGASINLLPYSIYKQLGLEALTPTRMTLELANRSITHPMGIAEDVLVRVNGFTFLTDFVVVNFEPDPRVPIILGRPFLRTAKALIDLYEETLTLRIGKEELVYYADKSKKNKDKNFVHAISVIDFSKADPFSGSTTIPSDAPFPSSSLMKTSDNFEKFADELAPLDSLPPGNDDSTLKKDLHEENFQVYSNPLFEFDDNFKSSNVNPLFEEKDKDVEIKFFLSPHLLHRKKVNLKLILKKIRFHRELILPSLPPLKKKIICLLATYLHQKPKPLSRPQEVEEIKEKDEDVSSDVPINTIVMPIRITFDNPIDFNDNFSKPKDFKKDLTVTLDSTESSILPPPLLDSDSPFTAELLASITLNSLRNEDKVFKPGILVYHAIHDKSLVTLEENLKENISSGTLLVFKESYFLLPPPEPPDECLNFEPILVMKNVVLNEDFYQSKKTLPLNVEDVNSFIFVIWTFLPYFTYTEESPLFISFRSEDFVFDPDIVTFHKPVAYISKITRKPSKTGKHGHEERKSMKEARDAKPKLGKVKKSKLWSTSSQPWSIEINPQKDKTSKVTTLVPQDDNSSDQQQNGRVNYVKSSTLIGSLKPHGLKEAQEKRGFALCALTQEAHMLLNHGCRRLKVVVASSGREASPRGYKIERTPLTVRHTTYVE
ncbi:reverse transcriptase domain-containing protein, partial [Tanacetum coccineum]